MGNKIKIMQKNRENAIKFLEARLAEEEEKEHNWKYEIENCLFFLRKDKIKEGVR